jgi:hypothetical protein
MLDPQDSGFSRRRLVSMRVDEADLHAVYERQQG